MRIIWIGILRQVIEWSRDFAKNRFPLFCVALQPKFPITPQPSGFPDSDPVLRERAGHPPDRKGPRLSARELLLLGVMCVVWGFHYVVMKVGVGAAPPIFYAAVRMTIVSLALAPFLRWRPGKMGYVLAGAICFGSLNYAFLFTGFSLAPASVSAIVLQLYVVFATLLAVVILKERIGWPRRIGIALALCGVLVISFSRATLAPAGPAATLGLLLVGTSALIEAAGSLAVKKADGFAAHELLAWFATLGAPALFIISAIFETGQHQAMTDGGWPFFGAALYSALGASLIGHTTYYWLLKRLPVTIVASSSLLTTVIAIGFSVTILNEPLTQSFLVGGALTLAGVAIILYRRARKEGPPRTAGGAIAAAEEQQT
jgi:O-acetylserine/cysteine efflux transporter